MDFVTTYWLNWRVGLCALWILTSITLDVYLIKKYERALPRNTVEEEEEHIGMVYEDEIWKTCSKQIHPACLMGYRICVFFVLLILFFLNTRVHGFFPFYYYTQWTLTLSYIYFLFGSMFSIYGWFRYGREELDEEQAANQRRPRRVAGFWGYVFQVIYQLLAGAVVLANCLDWFDVLPYLVIKVNMKLNFLGKTLHSVNAVFFLGEAALNNLRFPWFRIAYFALWTCIYVVFHWALHALSRTFGWPYPFLNLAYSLSPLLYFLLSLSHVACYGVIYLLIKLKHFLLKNLLQDR